MSLLVGVDIGGTNTVIGLVEEEGRILARRKVQTASLGKGADLPAGLAEQIRSLVRDEGRSMPEVAAVGVGTPGIVDPVRGLSVNSVNLGYRNFPMAEKISQAVEKPVFLDNDVRMYALGETGLPRQ